MGFWAWFAIWAGLGIAALIALALIGYELFNKSSAVLHQLERILKAAQPLEAALAEKSAATRPTESLLAPAEAIVSRRALIKARQHKASERQRRLIDRLKDIKIDESRFR